MTTPQKKPGTFSRNYQHLVFAVKYRQALIEISWREELEKYITAIIQNDGNKLLAIYAMRDHIHILFQLKNSISISDMVRDIKVGSTNFINTRGLSKSKFQWQGGYGHFSVSHKDLGKVADYIRNQENHHASRKFKSEFVHWLKHYEIDYSDEYMFDWIMET